jgi:hypothetical protein
VVDTIDGRPTRSGNRLLGCLVASGRAVHQDAADGDESFMRGTSGQDIEETKVSFGISSFLGRWLHRPARVTPASTPGDADATGGSAAHPDAIDACGEAVFEPSVATT